MNSRVRIFGALVVGAVIIGGAFYLRNVKEEPVLGTIDVGHSAPRGAITATDSNGDGISDWEESLRTLTLERASSTAGQIAGASADYNPTTVTDRFAQDFFQKYLETGSGGTLSADNQKAFLDTSIASLQTEVHDDLYTKERVKVGDGSFASLRTYGNTIATILEQNDAGNTENELIIFQRAVEQNSAPDFSKLTNIASAYNAMLAATLEVAVPPALVDEHVALVNAYTVIRNDVAGMAQADADPLYALLRTRQYTSDAQALYDALSAIYIYLYNEGITYADDEPAAMFKIQLQ